MTRFIQITNKCQGLSEKQNSKFVTIGWMIRPIAISESRIREYNRVGNHNGNVQLASKTSEADSFRNTKIKHPTHLKMAM
jgi:hypothetical protein